MVEAIAQAAGLPAGDVRRAVMLAGDARRGRRAALGEGAAGLARFALQLFRPVQPMLAQPAEDVGRRAGAARRGRASSASSTARASRCTRAATRCASTPASCNEVTGAVPELVEAAQALPARELILDGEAIALRPDGRPQPFQVTMRRFGRKLDVDAHARTSCRCAASSSTSCALDGDDAARPPGARALRRAGRRRARRASPSRAS